MKHRLEMLQPWIDDLQMCHQIAVHVIFGRSERGIPTCSCVITCSCAITVELSFKTTYEVGFGLFDVGQQATVVV